MSFNNDAIVRIFSEHILKVIEDLKNQGIADFNHFVNNYPEFEESYYILEAHKSLR